MSLFDEFEVSGGIHLPNDSATTLKTTYDWDTADYTININIIRMTPEEEILFGEEMAMYRANVDGTNAEQLVKGAGVKVGTARYAVTNLPKENKLFPGTYSIRLRQLNA